MANGKKNGKNKVVGKPAVKKEVVLDNQPSKEAGSIGDDVTAEGMNATCASFARKFARVKQARQAKDPNAFNKLVRQLQAVES